MPSALPATGLQLRSLVTADGRLELSLASVPVPALRDDDVLVRIEATPINPSDLGLLLGPADLATLRSSGAGASRVTSAALPAGAMAALASRVGEAMPVGNEGAGTVIAAGAAPEAQALVGRLVAILGGAMYAQYRAIKARQCLLLPADATAADGASCFVNPLTSLGMTETMRREGHTALVHTAAASNLGQMLNRICIADGIGLVNIVRSPAQAALLRDAGAAHVCDSSLASFEADLTDALAATGATIGFDAIGGGRLAGQILSCMEAAINRTAKEYSRYGSAVHKQVYLYGMLDTGPTVLNRNYGMAWGVGGWLLTPFLQKIGFAEAQKLRERVARELKTTFASHYAKAIGLPEALDPAAIAAYAKRGTGAKFLINPQQGLG
ncbi:MAG: zinc-binding dehydrogenase [Burkholderiales bacterium]|nr:zinc-binding dehydrogenase [Burkholderiales bacterium]